MLTRCSSRSSVVRTPMVVGVVLAVVAVLLGVPSGPAAAADDDPGPSLRKADGDLVYRDPGAGPTRRSVSGSLLVVADDSGAVPVIRYEVVTPRGDSVALPLAEALPPGVSDAAVTAELTADGDVRHARVRPSSRSAAPVPSAHRVYLVKVEGRGSYVDPTTGEDNSLAVLPVLDVALQRWVTESNGAITSFTRMPEIRTATLSGPCASGSATWNQVDDEVWPGVNFGSGSGNHLLVMQPKGCGGGVGTVGSTIADGGKITFDAYPTKNHTTFVHEIGHNFSLSHAHANECEAGACADAAYGNTYSPMGASYIGDFLPPSLTSFDRTRLDLLQACEVPSLVLAPGQRTVTATFDLTSRATGSGTRGVRTVDPTTGTEYWVEWRDGTGRDARAAYATSGSYRPGVTVMSRLDATTSQLQTTSLTSGGDSRFSLLAGESYSAGGLSVTADSTGTTSQVTLTLTNPSVPNAPALPAQAGTAATARFATVGSRLTAAPTRWTAGACYRYQWLDNGRPVPGARSQTFTVPSSLRGHRVSVRVTGQRSGFAARSVVSPAVVVGRFAAVAKPQLRGKAKVGRTLRTQPNLGRWAPAPATARYSWFANGVRVRGVSKPALKLTKRLRGKRIVVKVTGIRAGYASVVVASRATARVKR